jgi:hypothetical protein
VTYTLDGERLVEKQKGSYESVNVRFLEEGKLVMVIIYLINIEEEKENRLCIHTLILTNKQYIILI